MSITTMRNDMLYEYTIIIKNTNKNNCQGTELQVRPRRWQRGYHTVITMNLCSV